MSLITALEDGDFITVEDLLLDPNKIDTTEVDKDGNNALLLAVIHDDPIALEIWPLFNLNNVNNTGENVCHLAVKFEHRHLFELWIRRVDLKQKNNNGETILHLIVKSDNHSLLESILDLDLPWNDRDNDGETAFTLAGKFKDLIMIELLLPYVDVNAFNNDDLTVFMLGCKEYPALALRLLHEEKVDVNLRNREGITALNLVNSNQNPSFVIMLLRSGRFEVDTLYLMNNCGFSNSNIAFCLLKYYRFDLELRDNEGMTVLLTAAHSNNVELCRELLKKGANPCTFNNYGNGPLHYSLFGYDRSLLMLFLTTVSGEQLCKIINRKDNVGNSVFDMVSFRKSTSWYHAAINMLETACVDIDAAIIRADKDRDKNTEFVKRICVQRYRERRDFSTYLFPYLQTTVKEIIIVLLTL